MKAALNAINRIDLDNAIRTLSSDAFAGRYPASPGETLTIEFLSREFARVGAIPGNGLSYYQDVPMLKIANDTQGILAFAGGKSPLALAYAAILSASLRNSRRKSLSRTRKRSLSVSA